MFGNNNRLQIKPQRPPTVDLYQAPSGVVYQYVRPSPWMRVFKTLMVLVVAASLAGGAWYAFYGYCESSAYNCLTH